VEGERVASLRGDDTPYSMFPDENNRQIRLAGTIRERLWDEEIYRRMPTPDDAKDVSGARKTSLDMRAMSEVLPTAGATQTATVDVI
jgi:hypothetical protein